MQIQVFCECGNEVNVAEEQANTEYRCPRCGRRVFVDENDAKAFFDLSSSVDGDLAPPSSANYGSRANNAAGSSSALMRNIQRNKADEPVLDADATVVQSAVTPIRYSEKSNSPSSSAGQDETEYVEAGTDTMATIAVVSGPPSVHSGEFVLADPPPPSPPVLDDSSAFWNAAPTAAAPKFDLSQRIMRPIVKPVLPSIPYNGGGEYGIHRILRIHQRGGMGRILVAYDQYLKRDVAIKELHPDVAEDESIVRRFIGEAEITAQLEHPGVVPIHRLGQGHDGLPYYTMKMIKGETLQDAIKAYHRKPSQGELLGLVRRLVSVAKTMAFAHSKGVIHRDLKPANIMIGEHGETLVMDWGLAKPYNQGVEDSYISIIHRTKQPRPELTMVGAIVGTPAFMSPEQALAEENVVGPLSDVFSLGTILYYLLAGQTAFSGRSTQEVLSKVRAGIVTPPSQIKSNVPHELEQICLKAMAKLPEDRYQGAAEFSDDLCRWLDGEPIAAEKKSISAQIKRWIRRHRTLTIGLPAAVLLLGIFTCLNVWISGQNLDSQPQILETSSYFGGLESPVQIECTEGMRVWQESDSSGKLLISCQIEKTDTPKHRMLVIEVSDDAKWNVSRQHSLSFSLLAISPQNEAVLQNFAVRLGRKDAFDEYTPTPELWNAWDQMQWQQFKIPLKKNLSGWNRERSGALDLSSINRLELHFDTDAELILNIDGLRFE